MPDIGRFNRELRWLGVALLLYACTQAAIFGVTLVRRQSDVVERPGQIDREVTKLGGPCLAVKEHEYAKYGPLGIGDCTVDYTNVAQSPSQNFSKGYKAFAT